MPDPVDDVFATQNPQLQDDLNPPREDILKLVGLSAETAEKLAREESQNVLRLRTSFESGQTIYDQLKAGQEVAVIAIGSGQFPISPQEKPADFVKEAIARSQEIKPQPPIDEVKKLIEGFGDKALLDNPKEFRAATLAYNFIADGNLKQDEELLKKLTAVAQTDQEKYHLARALEEAIPVQSPSQMAPQNATDQLYSDLRPQAQPQPQPQAEPEPIQPQEIKKPYLPFASYKPPVDASNNVDQINQPADLQPVANKNNIQEHSSNGITDNPLANEPNLRPVPPRPQIKLAQDIA